MTFEEELAEALRACGELGSRRPNVDVMVGSLVPLITRELGEAWLRGVRRAFMASVAEPYWTPSDVIPANPYDRSE